MVKRPHNWLAAPNVSWAWVAATLLVWGIGLLLLFRSEAGRYLEARVARPIDFRIREQLGYSAALSSKLKIFSIDDGTFVHFGSWMLPMEDWTKIITTIAAKEPRAILIDSMFSKADGLTGDVTQALQGLKDIKVPLIIGSFVTPKPIRFREPLDLSHPDYSLSGLVGKAPPLPIDILPPLAEAPRWHAYGPTPEMRHVVSHVGHLNYDVSISSLVAPLIRLADDTVLGHISFYLGSRREIKDGKIMLDGVTVPVDAEGNVTVNFPTPAAFNDANRSMKGLLMRARRGQPTNVVEKGDVVLILPLMYTGNTDFKQTPFGAAPGGMVIAAMINSVITGQWLKPLAGGEALVLILALAGALVGMQAAVATFWVVVPVAAAAGFVLSQYLFAVHGIVVPWLFPLVSYLGAALTVFAEKTRIGEKKVRVLRLALEGSVAPDELKTILKKPELVSFEARERVVTLMFIDVVGFSLLAENMLPRLAFENLKKMLATLGDTVHQFGGIIDKTLGDGLLCYFGYRFDNDSSSPDHAEQALRCAIKIQRDNLMRNLEAASAGEPVYPLRIGVNSSSCYLGDLGSGQRIDFTVVGNGVNFAKRLEGACEMHSVLMGATTYDLVKGIGLPERALTRRFIRIKHHSELVETFEYDPFHEEVELRLAAIDGFRKCANIERVAQRWPVHDPSKLLVECEFGSGVVVNFSHRGMSVRLKQLLTRGTILQIALDNKSGSLQSRLAKHDLHNLSGEVRWGYADGTEYVHGVMFTGLSEAQSDAFVQVVCEFAFAANEGKLRSAGAAKGA